MPGHESTGDAPLCQAANPNPQPPRFTVPRGAWDCHAHLFEDPAKYPLKTTRRYTPPPATAVAYSHMLATLGLDHAVIVQPGIYHDNRVTEDALIAATGRWRGIALLDPDVTTDEIRRLDDIGFRGVRFNPYHDATRALRDLETICAKIAPFGWHAQFHLSARQLPELAPRFEALPVDIVVDHLGHMSPASKASTAEPGFGQLLKMLEGGHCWVKVSAPNRFGDLRPPYPSVLPFAQALIAANPERVVWATDWPHSSHEGYMPHDGELLDVLADWAPDETTRNRILVDNPARLYGR
jgi:predicted TIM-barrel fold metal-dependent hydrolase